MVTAASISVPQLNFWRDNGGIVYYVKATLRPGLDPEEFFRHSAPQAAFRRWVGALLLTCMSDAMTVND